MRQALERALAYALDGALCGTMNALQWRHRANMCSVEEFQTYLSACSTLSRDEFYRPPPLTGKRESGSWIEWDAPVLSGFAENDRARVRLQMCLLLTNLRGQRRVPAGGRDSLLLRGATGRPELKKF